MLSSLGESESCLLDSVRKLPLTVEAILTPYDITREQPQLFVTRSCRHLTQVLDEFAETMCYQRGGAESVQSAIDAEVVATCEYSSGLQVSGRYTRMLRDALGKVVYIATEGPSQLAYGGKELERHGIEQHAEGFGSPVGRLCNLMRPLEEASEYDLQEMGIVRHERVELEFVSGVRVVGVLDSVLKQEHRIQLMSFSDCTVTGLDGEVLFQPDWGSYDMAVGEHIDSVYPGSADPARFNVYPAASAVETPRPSWTVADEREFELYAAVRKMRETGWGEAELLLLAETSLREVPTAWLLLLEILELLPPAHSQARQLREKLIQRAQPDDSAGPLIERGLTLLDNPSLAA